MAIASSRSSILGKCSTPTVAAWRADELGPVRVGEPGERSVFRRRLLVVQQLLADVTGSTSALMARHSFVATTTTSAPHYEALSWCHRSPSG
jgi:hypothetical protein